MITQNRIQKSRETDVPTTRVLARDAYGFLEQVADVLPETANERVQISHFVIDDEQFHRMEYERKTGDKFSMTKLERTYTRLGVNVGKPQAYDDWVLMMTDTDMERITNAEFVREARGDVLVAGLGIGMVLHALKLPRPPERQITSITVVEKYEAVIEAVRTSIDPSVRLVHADIDSYTPDSTYDTIYFDIWPDRSTDNIPHINALHRRGRKWLQPGGWMGSWYHSELLKLRRKERESPRARLLQVLEAQDRRIMDIGKSVVRWNESRSQ